MPKACQKVVPSPPIGIEEDHLECPVWVMCGRLLFPRGSSKPQLWHLDAFGWEPSIASIAEVECEHWNVRSWVKTRRNPRESGLPSFCAPLEWRVFVRRSKAGSTLARKKRQGAGGNRMSAFSHKPT